ARDVSVPVRPLAHGPRPQLLDRRRHRTPAAHAGSRGPPSDRMGRVRAAGGERGDQARRAPRALDVRQHRPHAGAAPAARLLVRLPGWPERVVAMQRHWIGRSEGAEIRFPLDGRAGEVGVFTTRPDTLFGVTFMSLAPEHPLAGTLAAGTPHEASVAAFVARM